jgi:hypothetical protein
LKFDEPGELLGRPFLHQVIREDKDVIVGTVGGDAVMIDFPEEERSLCTRNVTEEEGFASSLANLI